jgi:hypothetical protein
MKTSELILYLLKEYGVKVLMAASIIFLFKTFTAFLKTNYNAIGWFIVCLTIIILIDKAIKFHKANKSRKESEKYNKEQEDKIKKLGKDGWMAK